MTSEMVFECLLVSRNVDLLRTMNRLLELLSIQTRVCMTSWRALELLPTSHADLVVLDWDQDDTGAELLRKIWSSESRRKPTIVAIANGTRSIPGAHVLVSKPLTLESGAKSLGIAYAKMLHDHRQHARHALMIPVVAIDQNNCEVPVTITDIGKQGIGLRTMEQIETDDKLSLDVLLPDARKSIHLEARVLWSRQYVSGQHVIAGCEFVRIPPVDADILNEWCRNKCKVKNPAKEVAFQAS